MKQKYKEWLVVRYEAVTTCYNEQKINGIKPHILCIYEAAYTESDVVFYLAQYCLFKMAAALPRLPEVVM